jgi:branched-chain amino acid aminotransferase
MISWPRDFHIAALRGITGAMSNSTHNYRPDERNAGILININGELLPREQAVVSVFDSGFILGDGIWEGLRLHGGVIPFLARHLKRLWEGARALDLDLGLARDELARRLYETVDANGMSDHVHIRLMVTRGIKSTPYQDPAVTIGGPTVVIIPEYKSPDPDLAMRGIRLYTVYVRRGYADVQDPRINSHSKLNCIFGCIQAAKAGYDEALMLDPHGHVATCNSTHFFIVREGEVWTSSGDYCLDGITRRNIIELCRANDIPVFEKNFSVAQVYGAEEAFVTGTFAGLTPVQEVDGRMMGEAGSCLGPVTRRLQSLYSQLIEDESRSGRG